MRDGYRKEKEGKIKKRYRKASSDCSLNIQGQQLLYLQENFLKIPLSEELIKEVVLKSIVM